MRTKKLLWKFLPPLLFIIFAAVISVMLNAAGTMRRFHLEEKSIDLERLAAVLEPQIKTALTREDQDLLAQEGKRVGEKFDARVTVIDADGWVLSDTHEAPAEMDNHIGRPEISEASEGRPGRAERYSSTLQTDMLYVAVPLYSNSQPTDPLSAQQITAYLRLAVPLASINEALKGLYFRLILGGLAAAVLTAIVGYMITLRVTKPLIRVKNGAERFAAGELEHKIGSADIAEMDALAETLNYMAGELNNRIRTVREQKNELNAILASMAEGVIAVDTDRRIITVNQAAVELLNVSARDVKGRLLDEIIRNSDLKAFIDQTLQHKTLQECEIEIRGSKGNERFLLAGGTALLDAENTCFGAVIVLDDQTKLRRLEKIRSDFVANVSHELRTPITSIKGFVETLLDDEGEVEDKKRFLSIIARQADRLTAIIHDLLILSSIEKDAESSRTPELRPVLMQSVLEDALETCAHKAEEKGIEIEVECEQGLKAHLNPELFEQAIINLVENAVKYSPENSTVQVKAECEGDDQIAVHVIDQGCGIKKEHLDRLFERFYRVDKARSRSLGGTGLGLSIARHITLAHQGSIEVKSEWGKGSVFTIHIPVNSI